MTRCLWLTRVAPYPPNYGGDMIYSSRLIENLSRSDVQVTVLCHDSSGATSLAQRRRSNARWLTVGSEDHPAWTSLLSRRPSIAFRSSSSGMAEKLRRLLEEDWNAIVFDNLATGWALDLVRRQVDGAGPRPKLVYVSHNHEESVRQSIAESYTGSRLKRMAMLIDADKAAKLERAMVGAADLVTVNTAADAALYRARRPDKDYLILTPGYDGPVLTERTVNAETPPRAVIAGSFVWIAKQINIESFLETAASSFDAAGIELQVIGSMPERFRRRLRSRFPSVDVVGTVEDFSPYLRQARLCIVPEALGGGFKHKLLQMAFNRVPIVALTGTAEGTPLVNGESIVDCDDIETLVRAAVALIDDLDRLHRLQEAAFAACEGRFDWAERGAILASAIAGVGSSEQAEAA
ncbi:MAG TPA: glycosyltransferase [Dehalococcoidia bacterium]|nr:glycosyltransferase [Dehalococcoidia bacterium]